MDETSLKLYGLNDCRWILVKKLRSTCYSAYIVGLIISYALLLTTCFLCHDIWYEERAVEYLANIEVSTSSANVTQLILFVTELVILGLIIIDAVSHAIGYGMLYLARAPVIFEAAYIVVNTVLIIYMMISINQSKSLFGVKMLSGVTLLCLKIDTLNQKFSNLCKSD